MEYLLHLGILIVLFAVLALSLNYIAGYAGIMSFSHAAFMGIGAYATAILTKTYGLHFLAALLIALLITAGIAFLASFFILRLGGDSLLLVSFGFTLIIYNIFLNWTELTNGALGIKAIPAPHIWGMDFSAKLPFFMLCFILLLLIIILFSRIVRSPYGTIIRGIRENEMVVAVSGYDAAVFKRSVFVLGSTVAGAAGGLYASYLSFIEPSLFQLFHSVLVLVMCILGGLATISGSIAGAAILIVFPELLRFAGIPDAIMAETQQILYGLLLFALIFFRPQGLFGKYRL